MRWAATVFATGAGLLVFGGVGCSEQRAPLDARSDYLSAEQESELAELSKQSGVVFANDAAIISSGDGGGREQGFHEWVIFSASPIAMPSMQIPSVEGYLKMPLAESVKFVESRMIKRRIQEPLEAFDSSWQTNGFGFTGTLVRSSKGDFLVLVRGHTR